MGLNGNDEYITNSYSSDGLTTTTNAKGETFTVVRDKAGKIKSTKYGTTIQARYTHNADSSISSISVGSDINLFLYDDLLRLKTIKKNNSPIESYTYNDYGKLSSRSITNGANHNYSFGYTEDSSHQLSSMTVGSFEEKYKTDCLGRSRELVQTLGDNFFSKQFGYYKNGDHATNRVNTIFYGKNGVTCGKTTYTYDEMGNITSVNEDGKQVRKYKYDSLSRIICEEDIDNETKTWYTYDNQGNILTKCKNGVAQHYCYEIGTDKLVSFNNELCQYDAIGNPTKYRDLTLSWSKGRQLNSITSNGETLSFNYNGLGQRTGKGQITYTYDSNGTIISQVEGATRLNFVYGSDGVIGFEKVVGSTTTNYLFKKNLLGDVVAIYNGDGEVVATYSYDAWGNHKVYSPNGTENTSSTFIGNVNPFRYRSYYYDTETGLYFLKTRYYDPETCRFITIDDISYLNPESINGLNLYAYCNNNPVMYTDSTGTSWTETWWGKALGWVATGLLVVGAVAAIAVVAAGTVASGGLLGAVLVGAGVGALASMGASIVVQGGIANMGDVNPWAVFSSGLLGAAVGAISGATSFAFSQIGQVVGQSVGYALSNARHIGTGIKFAKVFGVSTKALMSFGGIAGSFAGGMAGTFVINKLATDFVDMYAENVALDNPTYVKSGLLKLFKYINSVS